MSREKTRCLNLCEMGGEEVFAISPVGGWFFSRMSQCQTILLYGLYIVKFFILIKKCLKIGNDIKK